MNIIQVSTERSTKSDALNWLNTETTSYQYDDAYWYNLTVSPAGRVYFADLTWPTSN